MPKSGPPIPLPPPTGIFALPPPTPTYIQSSTLRLVRPYWYPYSSHAKGRWIGRTIGEVYREWVQDMSEEYYEWAFESGNVRVNNLYTEQGKVVENGDLISNVLHRHEGPVVAGPLNIIYDGRLEGNDGCTLVVEKPGSLPVHSTARYHFNTLLSILKYEYGFPLVHTSNRLDRLTSGVMICALTVDASKRLAAWFGGRRNDEGGVSKEYVARVKGEFPVEEVVCEVPLLTINKQIGVTVVHPEGKAAKTIFRRLSYNPLTNTSVVTCKPITGRTHQIRVHLQYLQYPIANDPVYGTLIPRPQSTTTSASKLARHSTGQAILARALRISSSLEPEEAKEGTCKECLVELRDDESPQLFIYLHALRYTTSEWDYSTPLPPWASPSYSPSL